MNEGLAGLIAESEKGQEIPEESETKLGASEDSDPKGKEAPEDEELGVDQSDDDGPKTVPLSRFVKENRALKSSKARVAELEKELGDARNSSEPTPLYKEADRLFGKYEDPVSFMRDAEESALILYRHRENPDVQKVLRFIQQNSLGGQNAVTQAEPIEKTEAPAKPDTPAADPRLDVLVQERITDQVDKLLGEAKVRGELHGPIRSHVLAQNPNPSRADVLASMQEYVIAQGWTKEFLRGSARKDRPSPVLTPSGLGGNLPSQKAKKETKEEAPKTISGMERQNRNRLQELMREKGMGA